jgi:hypothetical protein
VAGEGFGLIMGAEGLLFAREERQRAASEVNTGRWIATVRVESASTMLAVTEAALLKEMGRGGCKSACQALQAEAGQARQRLEAANRALQSAPAEKNTALLAATLRAFTLLAFGGHVPNQGAAASPGGPATQVPAAQGREAQVRSFVEAYRKRHGRDPSFTEVRNILRLPPSTASV